MGKEIRMFDTVAQLRIMPKSPDVNLTEIENNIKKILSECKFSKFHSSKIKPIAFGLNALEVVILITEAKSELEQIENSISKLENVESVIETDIHLLSDF